MKKCPITVFDYCDATHNSSIHTYDKNNPPEIIEYKVNAWCVGGLYGVKAFFIKDGKFYEASGDDGHWWLTNTLSTSWIKKILEALIALYWEGQG